MNRMSAQPPGFVASVAGAPAEDLLSKVQRNTHGAETSFTNVHATLRSLLFLRGLEAIVDNVPRRALNIQH